jgi:carbonic anhydrase
MHTFYAHLSLAFISLFGTLSAAQIEPLQRLQQGNEQYVNSTTVCHEDWTAKRVALVEGQKPFAVIVSCSDSRVPPEIIFDQTLGALFVVRVAGNIVDDFAIGSIEYGVTVLGAKLIVVLGHAGCGAVDAALKGMKFNNHIQDVLDDIQPAVEAIKGQPGNSLELAIKQNVRNVKETLISSKPVLAKLFSAGSLKIEGGYYHLDTGKVEFLNASQQ